MKKVPLCVIAIFLSFIGLNAQDWGHESIKLKSPYLDSEVILQTLDGHVKYADYANSNAKVSVKKDRLKTKEYFEALKRLSGMDHTSYSEELFEVLLHFSSESSSKTKKSLRLISRMRSTNEKDFLKRKAVNHIQKSGDIERLLHFYSSFKDKVAYVSWQPFPLYNFDNESFEFIVNYRGDACKRKVQMSPKKAQPYIKYGNAMTLASVPLPSGGYRHYVLLYKLLKETRIDIFESNECN